MTELHLVVGKRRTGKSAFAKHLIQEELNSPTAALVGSHSVQHKMNPELKKKELQVRLGLLTKEDFQLMAENPKKVLKGRPGAWDRPKGRPVQWFNCNTQEGKPDVLVMEDDGYLPPAKMQQLAGSFDRVIVHKTEPTFFFKGVGRPVEEGSCWNFSLPPKQEEKKKAKTG